jgi:hypothetical protein
VCSVNPAVIFRPPEMTSGGPMDDRRRFCLPRNALATAFATAARDESPVQWVDKRLRSIYARLPKPLRTAAWRLRRGAAGLKNKPGERLGELAESGTDVLLICGRDELQPFLETGLDLGQAGFEGVHVETIPTLEHALLFSRDRDSVAELIYRHVLTHFRRTPAA